MRDYQIHKKKCHAPLISICPYPPQEENPHEGSEKAFPYETK